MNFFTGAASGVIGGLGGFMSSLFGQNQQKKIMREQMAYQTQEREAAQAYQTQERQAQNAFNLDVYNKYSSPQAMVQQYKDAGLNPLMAMGDGSGASVSSGAVGASQGMSSPDGFAMQGFGSSLTSGFVNIANALKTLGEAKKTGIETQYLEEEIKERIRGMKLSDDAQDLLNSINYKYLDQKNKAELDTLLQQLGKGDVEIEVLKQTLSNLEKDGIISQKQIDTFMDKFNKDMEVADSAIGLNNANASLANEKAISEPINRQVLYSTIDNLNARTKESLADAALKEWQYEIESAYGFEFKAAQLLDVKYAALSHMADAQSAILEILKDTKFGKHADSQGRIYYQGDPEFAAIKEQQVKDVLDRFNTILAEHVLRALTHK